MTIVINLIIIPSMALIGSQVGKRLRQLSKRLQNQVCQLSKAVPYLLHLNQLARIIFKPHSQLANITNVAFESINNIRTVKMLGIEDLLLW